jgi:hypothetical protein
MSRSLSGGDLLRDLEELKQITITSDDKEVILRTELKGDTGKVFQAAGVTNSAKSLHTTEGEGCGKLVSIIKLK